MIDVEDTVVWINSDTKKVLVSTQRFPPPHGYSVDIIGVSYASWVKSSEKQKIRLMLETVIDLAMMGFAVRDILREFAKVKQFRALGMLSQSMCRPLSKALNGTMLEIGQDSNEELKRLFLPSESVEDE